MSDTMHPVKTPIVNVRPIDKRTGCCANSNAPDPINVVRADSITATGVPVSLALFLQ